MPESKSKYFELEDHVGVTADGNLEPLVEIGLVVTVPTMVEGEVVDAPHTVKVEHAAKLGELAARIVPGTRIVESSDYRVNVALLGSGFVAIDPPTKAAVAKAAKALTDAASEAGTHDDANPTPKRAPRKRARKAAAERPADGQERTTEITVQPEGE
jgi:hypothetical protein